MTATTTILIDAENIDNIPANIKQLISDGQAGLATYLDGSLAMYNQAKADYPNSFVLGISTQGLPYLNLNVVMYDVENGNASAGNVALAVKDRVAAGLVSIIYSSHSPLELMTEALTARGMGWTDAEHYPTRGGVFLLDANPGVTAAESSAHINGRAQGLPCDAVGTQWLWAGDYDQSEVVATLMEDVVASPVVPPQNPEPEPVLVSAPEPAPAPAPVAPAPAPVPPAHRNIYTPLAIDGEMGPQTTKALQFVVWGGNEAECDGELGPNTARALQAHLGVSQDGNIGPVTVRALQARVQVPEDGVWGPVTTRGLQEHLNAGTF